MPALPFSSSAASSASPSPSSSPTTTPSTPSIVLHPAATGPSSSTTTTKPKHRELYKSSENAQEAYRARYAQYLASTFNMSIQAARAEADSQLAPPRRSSSDMPEAETLREI